MTKILVTGGAGFIGSHLIDKLLLKHEVINVDDFNDYYDSKIKERNIKAHLKNYNYRLVRLDIRDFEKLERLFWEEKPKKIIHVAARAGIRPSLSDPYLYFEVNVVGTKNLLDLSVKYGVEKFIFGSSSSVYGNTGRIPFSEDDLNLKPISPYGSSKKAAENLVASYNQIYQIPSTILRFFTVYGPRGRPDMAPYLFTRSIFEGRKINKFGQGETKRDYTYIDDIVEGVILALGIKAKFEIINLGNSNPVSLNDFIKTLEKLIGRKAKIIEIEKQKGDVEITFADITKAQRLLGWKPKTNLENGLKSFIDWFKKV